MGVGRVMPPWTSSKSFCAFGIAVISFGIAGVGPAPARCRTSCGSVATWCEICNADASADATQLKQRRASYNHLKVPQPELSHSACLSAPAASSACSCSSSSFIFTSFPAVFPSMQLLLLPPGACVAFRCASHVARHVTCLCS